MLDLRRHMLQRATVAVLAVAGGLAWGATPLHAQEGADEERVRIVGTVVDSRTGEPIPGVRVAVVAGVEQRVTDDVGQFIYEELPLGVYPMILARPGYVTLRGDLAVDRSGAFTLQLDPVGYSEEDPSLEEGIARLSGEIYDVETGSPVRDALVRVEQTGATTATDARGNFRFERLPAGTAYLTVERLGYASQNQEVDLVSGGILHIRLPLSTDPLPMDEVEVSVEQRAMVLDDNGFYDRRSQGQGLFLTAEDVDERSPQTTTDLLQGLPGVTIESSPFNPLVRTVVLRGGRGRGPGRGAAGADRNCGPSVYIDGVKTLRAQNAGPVSIDEFMQPENIAGVEIYRSTSEIPPQYGGLDANCGVLVIWTKQQYGRR